ncbi:hypothetical protein SAMN05880501_11743 [Ureibacillus xyleni]|uniref:Uncharacterized protein n=1 Tax=Ureibacillus xyleni TaxID=614648 RepID=A0A285TT81_9BACL|nr:hypothetical protein [Ureibacillus xyleni]SOC24512.1 hypothetical protein SAMN05880501_11743 [Ureibacillus xyleni]
MKEVTVIKLTDVYEFNCDYYSKQFDCIRNDYDKIGWFWTNRHYIVDIFENSVTEDLPSVQEAIKEGAILKKMYFVEDRDYESRYNKIYDILGNDGWDGVEGQEDYGVIFDSYSDAMDYQICVNFLTNNYQRDFDSYEDAIEKELALYIIDRISYEEVARKLLRYQKYGIQGAVCYLDIFTGLIYGGIEKEQLSWGKIPLAYLSKDYNRVEKRIESELSNCERSIAMYDAFKLACIMEFEDFEEALDEFYDEYYESLP